MTATRSAVFLILVATVGLTVAPVASGDFVDSFTDGQQVDEPNVDEPESEEEKGDTSVSEFMHASTADTENTVESGMFEARYETADNESQETLVTDRTTSIEEQLERLEAERDELRDRKDELSPPEYQARMTRLTVEISALERALEWTAPRALDVGIEAERLATLQQNVADLAGPTIVDIAESLVGFSQPIGENPLADHIPIPDDDELADDSDDGDDDSTTDDEETTSETTDEVVETDGGESVETVDGNETTTDDEDDGS